MPSLFTRIINRELPAKIFHETDEVIVIQDIHPKDKIHLLIIPKVVTTNFYSTPLETLNVLDEAVKVVADKLQLQHHFRIVINNGYGQEVDHIHYHFFSDRGAEKLKFIE